MKTSLLILSGRSRSVQAAIAGIAIVFFAATPSAQAASSTWTGTGNAAWTGGTWDNGVPGDSGTTTNTDVATFASSGALSTNTITVDSNRNVGGITFNGTSKYLLTGGSLILSNGGEILATSANGALQTINTSLILEGDASIINNGGSSSTRFTFGGATISEASGVSGTLTYGGTDSPSVAAAMSNSMQDGALGGTLNFVKMGSPGLQLLGASTYTGSTTVYGTTNIAGGFLQLGDGGSIKDTSSLTVEGGGTFIYGQGASHAGVTNAINTAAPLTLGGAYSSLAGSVLNGTFGMNYSTTGGAGNNTQSLPSLTIASGSSDLIYAGAGTAGENVPVITFSSSTPYVRQTGGFVTLDEISTGTSSGVLSILFTSAPSGTGNVGGGLLLGAYLNGTDFILAQAGALTAPTYYETTTGISTASNYTGKNVDVNSSPTLTGTTTFNSLRFNTASETLTLATGTTTINSPGILVGSSGSGSALAGGTIETTASGGELIVYINGQKLTISSIIADNGGSGLSVGGGSNAKNAVTGTLTLSNLNTYTGATMVSSGATLIAGIAQSGSAGAFGNASAMTVALGATLNLNNDAETIGSLAGNGSVTLGSATLTTGADNTSTSFGGVISGTGGLTKIGSGTQTLYGLNTYTGVTNLNGGVIAANASGSVLGTSTSLGKSGNINFGGGTLEFTANDHTDYSGRIATGTSTGAVSIDVNGQAVSFATALTSNQSGGFTLSSTTGTGTLTFSGASANTYGGVTTISGGELDLGKTAGVNAIPGNVTINGTGTLKLLANEQIANTSDITQTAGTFNLNSHTETIHDYTKTGGTFTTGVGGKLIGTGASVSFSNGNDTINADGSVTDAHVVLSNETLNVDSVTQDSAGSAGGILQVNSGGTGLEMSNSTINLTSDSNSTKAGHMILNGDVTTSGSGLNTITSTGAGATKGYVDIGATGTRTLNTVSGADLAVAATVTDSAGLALAGTGKVNLNLDNTYSGGTTVGNGTDTPTLVLGNGASSVGSATGTGALTVNTGATITGDGASRSSSFAINGNVIVGNGTDATSQTTITGASASTITNASLTFNLDAATGDHNELNVSASPSITFSGTTLTLNLLNYSTPLIDGTSYVLVDGTSGVNYFGLGLNPMTAITSGLTLSFSNDTSNLYGSSYLFLSSNGQDIELEIKTGAAVPEPSTWAMMLGGLGLLLFFQIRRRRNS